MAFPNNLRGFRIYDLTFSALPGFDNRQIHQVCGERIGSSQLLRARSKDIAPRDRERDASAKIPTFGTFVACARTANAHAAAPPISAMISRRLTRPPSIWFTQPDYQMSHAELERLLHSKGVA